MNKIRKRDNLELIADILRVVQNDGRISRIIYGAEINYAIAFRYLSIMQKTGLVKKRRKRSLLNNTKNASTNRYEITEKGLEYFQLYKEYKEKFSELLEVSLRKANKRKNNLNYHKDDALESEIQNYLG